MASGGMIVIKTIGIVCVTLFLGCAGRGGSPTGHGSAASVTKEAESVRRPYDPLHGLGIYGGGDLCLDLYGEPLRIDRPGHWSEYYAYIRDSDSWCGWVGRDGLAQLLSRWNGDRKLAIINVPVEVE